MSWFSRATPLADVRWVVVDTETSSLDPHRACLLSIGAVVVGGGRIALGEPLSVLVKQAEPSAADNILVHGIGGDAQLAGLPAGKAVARLETFLGGGVPAAFHAGFDIAVLRRHGLARRPWLDLDPLAHALFPEHARLQALDDWLDAFGIQVHERHEASLDALATAELFLVLLAAAARQGVTTLEAALATARARRWLSR